ncbi:hypothetical protein [Synechococcus sp. RedBA-s]|uniref:hypothetical protein n=1 Tax=Synechococcus sp. RedBA-s TaxID=2823741 RepID=UPI0020CC7A5D|nr:hypothetical protein [Synechococcus sp. RedBA-s]MCP9800843.1 hypothetical protein [Synechococcus sp. RedBA-s]
MDPIDSPGSGEPQSPDDFWSVPVVQRSCGVDGGENPAVLLHAGVNASFETGFSNPIDGAIRDAARAIDLSAWRKLDEIPFDFNRKRLSVLACADGAPVLITKGVFLKELAVAV